MTAWVPSFLATGHHSNRVSLAPGQKTQQWLALPRVLSLCLSSGNARQRPTRQALSCGGRASGDQTGGHLRCSLRPGSCVQ